MKADSQGSPRKLYGIWGSETLLWAVGSDGIILRKER